MVRVGEFSPNFQRDWSLVETASRGIFGFGEYEEKRKYYNEQRKLEYKQYLAQKALSSASSCDSKNYSYISTENTGVFPSIAESDLTSTILRKEVAIQTMSREHRDASTNTDAYVDQSGELKLTAAVGLTSPMKDHFHDLDVIRETYERELRGLSKEENRLSKERVRREQMEEGSPDRCQLPSEEVSGQLVRDKQIIARRSEESLSCQEGVWREAEGKRQMNWRDCGEMARNTMTGVELESVHGKCFSSGEVLRETIKCLPKGCAAQSPKSANLQWRREKCDSLERIPTRELHSARPEVQKASRACGTAPVRDDGQGAGPSTAKNANNILSHLGEVRRQLAMQQIKMEEALKKNKCGITNTDNRCQGKV